MPKGEKINWEIVITEQKRSGKSIKEFCGDKGIHPSSFYRGKRETETQMAQGLVEIKTGPTVLSASGVIKIHYKDFMIETRQGFCEKSLAKVITVLRRVS